MSAVVNFPGPKAPPLPSNVEAEAAFLGAVMRDNALLDQPDVSLTPADFFEPTHARIFEANQIASNDNVAIKDPSQPGTIVEGKLLGTVAIASPSIQRIADLTGFGITKPLADILERTLGVDASDALGLGLGGYLTGGSVGGLLGGLKGIVDSQKTELQKSFDKAFGDSGLSGDIGNALKGAQTGTATSGIMKSLGIKTSTTAAQIGGALGAASGIPGADIIASITWGFIGGLFKKTKSGSATIGNLDGSLGISGTGGNSGKYIEAASDGAGGIISSINRIADALGGIVDPSRGSVSLGNGIRACQGS